MKSRYLLPVILAAILCFGCERERIDPVDIFATESLSDPVNLNLGEDAGLDKLLVNADRIISTPSGYHVKGTIFSESVSGIIPVTSGDFLINTTLSAAAIHKGLGGLEFKGYGTANFPSADLFKVSEIEEVPGSEVYYNTGKIFKAESKTGNLPLLNDRYYFRYRVDKGGKEKEYKMKKITVKLREFYLDARDPATLFTGDIYSQTTSGAKKLIVEKASVGISANELWEFTPFTYSQNLETITGGTGFEKMNGGISLTGTIPVKKYPLEIIGQAVINTSFSTGGPSDFFERGFDEASFRIGVNGELFFTNDLVKFLTNVDTVKLGQATLQAEFSDDNFSIRMAGEYSDNVLERILGKTMMKYIPYNAREGVMYLRGSENPDDFLIYLEEKISVNIPGLGLTPVSDCIFKVTKNEVGLSGSIQLPYDIGSVNVTGILRNDGSFLLKGITDCNVNLGSGLSYDARLEVQLTETGVILHGAMSFPYGLGDVDVIGGISIDELYFTGMLNSLVSFPVNASVNSSLLVTISSKTGIKLAGSLELPGGIGAVAVTGTLSPSELLLKGQIKSGVAIGFGNVNLNTGAALELTASSHIGVIMTGMVKLPFTMGDASATVRVTSGGMSMTGTLTSKLRISDYPLFDANISVAASTGNGLNMSGQMRLPGNFGWVGIAGNITDSGYYLGGNISSSTIDFGIVKLSTDFSMSINNTSGIRISAEGEGCVDVLVDEVCADVDVDININYNSGSVELCMDFPHVGSACIGW
jgi:hypothetical protein